MKDMSYLAIQEVNLKNKYFLSLLYLIGLPKWLPLKKRYNIFLYKLDKVDINYMNFLRREQ